MKFGIYAIEKFQIEIPVKSFSLITGTPIIIRIHKEKYDELGAKLDTQYDEGYWRNDHPIVLFIQQLENSLSKKYNEYTNLKEYEPCLQKKVFRNNQKFGSLPFIQRYGETYDTMSF
jgi:CRISPR/Cas system endoribonuclease Cas6 (RAMP superfamily)